MKRYQHIYRAHERGPSRRPLPDQEHDSTPAVVAIIIAGIIGAIMGALFALGL